MERIVVKGVKFEPLSAPPAAAPAAAPASAPRPATAAGATRPRRVGGAGSGSSNFESKAPKVIAALSRDLGLTTSQAAGVVGQLAHESAGLQAINERSPMVKGSRGGFGWAQWTGPRRRQFEAWSRQNGLDPKSDDANYGFLVHELTQTPESKAVAAVKSAPDARSAGRAFTDTFLRPGIPGYSSRDKWTDRAEAIAGGSSDPGDFGKRIPPSKSPSGLARIVINADSQIAGDTMPSIPGVRDFDPLASIRQRGAQQRAAIAAVTPSPLDAVNQQRQAAGQEPLIAMPAASYKRWKEKFDANQPGILSDIGTALWSGTYSTVGNLLPELISVLPGGTTVVNKVNDLENWLRGETEGTQTQRHTEDIKKGYSARAKAAAGKDWVKETQNPDGSTSYAMGDAWKDPYTYLTQGVESLPATLLTMVPAIRLAKAAQLAAYEPALAKLLAAGKTLEEAAPLAQKAAAAAGARKAWIAGSVGEALVGGSQNAAGTREELSKVPIETWRQSDAFQALVKGGLSEGEAIEQLTSDATTQSYLIAAVADGTFGGLGDRTIAKILGEGVSGGLGKRLLKGAAKGIPGEVVEEMPQSAGEQVGSNVAARGSYDPDRPLTEGVANAAVGGGVIGGLMGAGFGGFAGARSPQEAPPVDGSTDATQGGGAATPPAGGLPPPAGGPGGGHPAAQAAGAQAGAGLPGRAKGPLERAAEHGENEAQQQVTREAVSKGAMPPGVVVTVTDPEGGGTFDGIVTGHAMNGAVIIRDDEGNMHEVPPDMVAQRAPPAPPAADAGAAGVPQPPGPGTPPAAPPAAPAAPAAETAELTPEQKDMRELLDWGGVKHDDFDALPEDEGTALLQSLARKRAIAGAKPKPAAPAAGKSPTSVQEAAPTSQQLSAALEGTGIPWVDVMAHIGKPNSPMTTSWTDDEKRKAMAFIKAGKAPAATPAAKSPTTIPASGKELWQRDVPKGRANTTATVDFPSNFDAAIYDVGDARHRAAQQPGARVEDRDTAGAEEQQKIADKLKVSFKQAGLLADDYRFHAVRAAESGQPMRKLNPKMLDRFQKEHAKAQAESTPTAKADAAAAPADPPPQPGAAVAPAGTPPVVGKVDPKFPFFRRGGRLITMMDIGGVQVPFYISTGAGGKAKVKPGQWYPFFGVGKDDGWFNKGDQNQINDYYGNPLLREAAEKLDKQWGDIRSREKEAPPASDLDRFGDKMAKAFPGQLVIDTAPLFAHLPNADNDGHAAKKIGAFIDTLPSGKAPPSAQPKGEPAAAAPTPAAAETKPKPAAVVREETIARIGDETAALHARVTPIDPAHVPDPTNSKPLRQDPENTLVLMACSDAKLDPVNRPGGTAPLYELYDGPFWQSLRKHGAALLQNTFALSGKWGFTSAGAHHKKYDEKISKQKIDALVERGIFEGSKAKPGTMPSSSPVYSQTRRSKWVGPKTGPDMGDYTSPPYTQVIIHAPGLYQGGFNAIVTQLQQAGVIAPDAPVRATSGDLISRRKQFGQMLRDVTGAAEEPFDAAKTALAQKMKPAAKQTPQELEDEDYASLTPDKQAEDDVMYGVFSGDKALVDKGLARIPPAQHAALLAKADAQAAETRATDARILAAREAEKADKPPPPLSASPAKGKAALEQARNAAVAELHELANLAEAEGHTEKPWREPMREAMRKSAYGIRVTKDKDGKDVETGSGVEFRKGWIIAVNDGPSPPSSNKAKSSGYSAGRSWAKANPARTDTVQWLLNVGSPRGHTTTFNIGNDAETIREFAGRIGKLALAHFQEPDPRAKASPAAKAPAQAGPTVEKPAGQPGQGSQRPVAPKPARKLGKKAQERADHAAAVADYFTPGNIVPSYGGLDRVIAYHPEDDSTMGWSVEVQHVIRTKAGGSGEYVTDPADSRIRRHATMPSARELKNGPVKRAAPASALVAETGRTEQQANDEFLTAFQSMVNGNWSDGALLARLSAMQQYVKDAETFPNLGMRDKDLINKIKTQMIPRALKHQTEQARAKPAAEMPEARVAELVKSAVGLERQARDNDKMIAAIDETGREPIGISGNPLTRDYLVEGAARWREFAAEQLDKIPEVQRQAAKDEAARQLDPPLEAPRQERTIWRDTTPDRSPSIGDYKDLGIDRLSFSGPLGEAARAEVMERGKNGNEHMLIFDANGDLVANGEGTPETTGMTGRIMNMMNDPDERLVMHHNHPGYDGGYVVGFSPSDIVVARLPGLVAIYAHNTDNSFRAAWLPNARQAFNQSSYADIERLLNGALKPIEDVLNDLRRRKVKTYVQVNTEMSHLRGMAVRDAGWIDYSADKPDSDFLAIPEVREAYDNAVAKLADAISGNPAVHAAGRTGGDSHPADIQGFHRPDEEIGADAADQAGDPAGAGTPAARPGITPQLRRWFGKSRVVDESGEPLPVYRGEHGEPGDADFQSRLPSLSFGSVAAANTYAKIPNDLRDRNQTRWSRVTPVYLKIENPIFENRDDPYVDFSEIAAKLGRPLADQLAREHADRIENTNNWEENMSGFADTVGDLLNIYPDKINDLYMDAYALLDDPVFIAAAKAAGYDGAIHIGNGETFDDLEYRIFDAAQAKSVHNQTPTLEAGLLRQRRGELEAPRQARAEVAREFLGDVGGLLKRGASRVASGIRNPKQEDFIGRIKSAWSSFTPTALGAIYLNYLPDLAPNIIKGKIEDYLTKKQAMDTMRKAAHDKAGATLAKWQKYNRLGPARAKELAVFMHDSTIAGVDADDLNDLQHPMYAAMRARFLAMPEAGRELYREVRDAYEAQATLLDKTIEDNVMKSFVIAERQAARDRARELGHAQLLHSRGQMSDVDLAAKTAELNTRGARSRLMSRTRAAYARAQLRQRMEANKVKKPYFPLGRFGKYYVAVRNQREELVHFTLAENKFQMRKNRKEASDAFRSADGFTVTAGLLDAKNRDSIKGLKPAFIAELEKIIPESADKASIMDQVWQRYLKSEMPELSARSHKIHRRRIEGYSDDAMKVFANFMFHAGHQTAKLEHGLELGDLVDEARLAAQEAPEEDEQIRATQIVDELQLRHAWVMNPKGGGVAQLASTGAFAFYLAASPGAAMVNLAQTPMVGIPVLGARFGSMTKAAAQIARAGRNMISGSGLNDGEKNAMKEFEAVGLIDRTQSMDIAEIGEEGTNYSPVRNKVMNMMSFLFHKAEVLNRRVTALAAYRMAIEAGERHEFAVRTATNMTWKVHFDLSNSSRPRYMQGDIGKILFSMRSYQVNMLYRLGYDLYKSFKGATPEEKKEARYQLAGLIGMQALFAGTTGVAGYHAAFALFGVLQTMYAAIFGGGDDEDDPFTLQEHFEQDVLSILGPIAGNIVLHGAVGTATQTDLASRVGMPDLWFRSPGNDVETAKDTYQFYLEQIVGAPLGIIAKQFGALDQPSGERWFEAAAPKSLTDLAKTYRYLTEGVATKSGGTVIAKDDVGWWSIIATAAGFTPAHIAEKWDDTAMLKGAENRVKVNRQAYINGFQMAVINKNPEARADALAKIRKFNRSAFGRTMPIRSSALSGAVHGFVRSEAKRERGEGILIKNERLSRKLREEMAQ